jgi:hypothetical protein
MMKEFCWDGNGEDLGSMKNECLEKVEGYYKSKILKQMEKIHLKVYGNP